MNTLIVGLIVFYGVHLLVKTPLRKALAGAIGENPYKGVFTLISFVGLGLMIWGFGMARSGPDAARIVYAPLAWGPQLALIGTLLALILLGASHGKGYIRKIVAHPMSLGIASWAAGHLTANGNLSEVLFFGSFLAYAVFDIITSLMAGKRPQHTPKIRSDIVAVVAGVVLFALAYYFHQPIIGVVPN